MVCIMRKLVFLLSLLLISSVAFSQQVYVLAVGVSDYPGVGNDLRLPVNDAKSFVELYKKNGAGTARALKKVPLCEVAEI